MKTYEIMVIFDRDAEENTRDEMQKTLENAIKQLDGTIIHKDEWGIRTFAYKINHKDQGYYIVWEFTATGGELTEIDRLLLLADAVVRHKILRLPEEEAERRTTDRGSKSVTAVTPDAEHEEQEKYQRQEEQYEAEQAAFSRKR